MRRPPIRRLTQRRQVSWLLTCGSITMMATLALCLPFLVHAFVRTRTSKPKSTDSHPAKLARMSDRVSVQAAGRGNPTINLSDGREVLTSYVGPQELRAALEENLAAPLSLASADFDEDGVPDLVSGYAYNGQGIVTMLRGNVDAIYPNAPEAKQRKAKGTFTDAPFLSPAQVFPAPTAADFIGAGDFDGDSHWDVVVGSRTANALYLLSGNGHGGFAAAQEIVLPGNITAMTTGEINRADGLTDVVVGVANEQGAEALIFEGPNGALKAQPETLPMPGTVTALALGQLDDSYEMDLAVGAGKKLLVVHGRDRKLSLDESLRARVPPAVTSDRIFETSIRSIAIGRFTNDAQSITVLGADGCVQLLTQTKEGKKPAAVNSISAWKSIAVSSGMSPQANLVSAHVSNAAHDDLLVVDGVNRQLRILHEVGETSSKAVSVSPPPGASLNVESAPIAVLPMRLNADALSDLALLSSGKSAPVVLPTQPQSAFVVTNTNANGPGSLFFAMTDANETPGADVITFNIPGPSPHVINQTVPLPTITDPVTIDGTTEPGFAGAPLVELSSKTGDCFANGIVISAGSSTVRGLAVSNYCLGYGVRLQGSGANVVEGNFFMELQFNGSPASGSIVGVLAPNNIIGGTVSAARNLLAGLDCVDNSGGNSVLGNWDNLTVLGTVHASTGLALQIRNSGSNTIGGISAGARNVFYNGKFIIAGEFGNTNGNLVQGNFIGTDPTGTVSSSNKEIDLLIRYGADNNTIGGSIVAARNIVSGSQQQGIQIFQANGNQVQGNYIGTDAGGIADLGSAQNGVYISFDPLSSIGAVGNVIGGTTAGARNVIAGNGLSGVLIEGAQTTGNFIQGNFIGTDAAGTAALGNDLNGVTTSQAPNNTIGGATPEARNIISANARHGVSIGIDTNSGATGITVRNNYIGTDVTGNNCLGNGRDGVFVNRGSVNHTIHG